MISILQQVYDGIEIAMRNYARQFHPSRNHQDRDERVSQARHRVIVISQLRIGGPQSVPVPTLG